MRQKSNDQRPKTILNSNRPKMLVLKPLDKKDNKEDKEEKLEDKGLQDEEQELVDLLEKNS